MKKKGANDFTIQLSFISSVLLIVSLLSCQSKEQSIKHKVTVSLSMLDSIKKASDSIYTKPYFTRDFTTAEYFINKKDSTATQVMKDRDSVIKQIVITKNRKRLFTAQYYSDGQLMIKYNLDKFGQYDGYSEEYYEDGFLKRSGIYKSGLHYGKWKNYNTKGQPVSVDEYNTNGRVINTTTTQ